MILCVFHVHWLELCLLRSSNLFIHVDKVSDLGFWIKPSVKLGLVQWHDRHENEKVLYTYLVDVSRVQVARWQIEWFAKWSLLLLQLLEGGGQMWLASIMADLRGISKTATTTRHSVQHHFGCPCKGKDLRNVWLRTIEPPMDYGRSMAFPFCPWADHVKHPTLDLGGSPQVAWGLLGRSGLFSWPLISVANDDATTATASCQGPWFFTWYTDVFS